MSSGQKKAPLLPPPLPNLEKKAPLLPLPNMEKLQPSTSSQAHQAIWQLNEPIDVDSYEPTVKDSTLPYITKVESIQKGKSTTELVKLGEAIVQVCNLLGLQAGSLKLNKEQLRSRNKEFNVEIDLQSDLVKSCKAIYISNLPGWFEKYHIEALIQLKSEFDTNSDFNIDMFQEDKSAQTGECLLSFVDNKDCLQVYKDLQGTQLLVWPLVINLDLGHEITEMRDHYRKNLLVKIENVSEMCKLESGDQANSSGTIKEEKECSDDDVQFIENAVGNELKSESNIPEKNGKNKSKNDTVHDKTDGNSMEVSDESSKESEQTDLDQPLIRDQHYYASKIVHVSNLYPNKGESYIDVVKYLMKFKLKFCPDYKFCEVKFSNNMGLSGDVLLEFANHTVTRRAELLLNGLIYNGRKVKAIIGAGYKMLPEVTTFDLEMFTKTVAQKRKLENSQQKPVPAKKPKLDKVNPVPAKKPKIDKVNPVPAKKTMIDKVNPVPAKKTMIDVVNSSTPAVNNSRLMTPEERCFDAYGLAKEFIVKHKLRVPFSRTIIVTKLHTKVTESKLNEVFSLAGDVKKITLSNDKDNRKYNKAVIDFDHPLESVQAISMLRGQKLFDVEMEIVMDEVSWRSPKPLPEGLSAVGPGLGNNGGPMRGLRNQADFRLFNEMFIDIGLFERVNNTGKPFKFTYNKIKLKDRLNNLLTQTECSSSNPNGSTSKDSIIYKSTQLAIQALGTVLVAQGFVPATTDTKSLQSILSGLHKMAASKNNEPTEQLPNQENAALNTNPFEIANTPRSDALSNAINSIMQFMPVNKTPNTQHLNPAQDMGQNNAPHTSGNVPQQGGYGNQWQRNQTQNLPQNNPVNVMPPSGYGNQMLSNSSSKAIPVLPTPTRRLDPRLTQVVPPQPYNNQMGQNFPQNVLKTQSYEHMQMEYRKNLTTIQCQTQNTGQHTNQQPVVEPYLRGNSPRFSPDHCQVDSQSLHNCKLLEFTNLPPSVNASVLGNKMSEVGAVKLCSMTEEGRAFVHFQKLCDAERCLRNHLQFKLLRLPKSDDTCDGNASLFPS